MGDRPRARHRGSGHLDGDDLAVLALDGAHGDDARHEHLAECADCAAEYARYVRVVDRIRGGAHDLPIDLPIGDVDPGEDVWQRIVAEVGERDDGPPTEPPASDGAVHPGAGRGAGRWTRRWLAVAAGVVLVAVVAAGRVAMRPDAPAVVATAPLAPLSGEISEPARAQVRSDDGALALRVEVPATDLGVSAGYLELWLLDEQADGMVSLGPVAAGTSRVTLPDGLDISRYPVVDVSREPLDGDPTHSGDSIWRGTLSL